MTPTEDVAENQEDKDDPELVNQDFASVIAEIPTPGADQQGSSNGSNAQTEHFNLNRKR